MNTKGHHTLVTIVALAATVALAAGCSSSKPSGSASAVSNSSGTSSASAHVVQIDAASEPKGLSPILATVSDSKVYGPIFDPLVGVNPKTNTLNDTGLLPSWTHPTPTTWSFTVRQGVKFSNGEDWDAAAAAFTINTNKNEPTSNMRTFLLGWNDATVSGDQVVVTTQSPLGYVPSVLAFLFGLPPAYFAKVGLAGFNTAPVGTGPYIFKKYTRGSDLALSPNPNYWGGRPPVGGMDIHFVADSATRAAQIVSGQADLALDMDTSVIQQYGKNDKVSVLTTPSSNITALMMRQIGDLSDVRARQAVQYSIDRSSLVKGLFGDQGTVLPTVFSDESVPDNITYDPDKAKALLKEIGHPVSVTFSYVTGKSTNDTAAGEAIANMLSAVGFKVTRNPMTYTNFTAANVKGSIQMGFTWQSRGTSGAGSTPYSFITEFLLKTSRNLQCANPQIDSLNTQANDSTSSTQATQLFTQIEKLWVEQMACGMPIYSYNAIYLASPRLAGFTVPAGGFPRYNTIKYNG